MLTGELLDNILDNGLIYSYHYGNVTGYVTGDDLEEAFECRVDNKIKVIGTDFISGDEIGSGTVFEFIIGSKQFIEFLEGFGEI